MNLNPTMVAILHFNMAQNHSNMWDHKIAVSHTLPEGTDYNTIKGLAKDATRDLEQAGLLEKMDKSSWVITDFGRRAVAQWGLMRFQNIQRLIVELATEALEIIKRTGQEDMANRAYDNWFNLLCSAVNHSDNPGTMAHTHEELENSLQTD